MPDLAFTQSSLRGLWLRQYGPPLGITLTGVAFKLLLLAFNAVPFNGDEGLVALMARHVLNGERPIFFYGQAYLGSTDAWLIALSFSIFGETVFAIRVVQIALFAGVVWTTYLLAKRYGLSEWGARAAMLWLALPPAMLTLYTTATLGGYGETLLLGNILLLIADSIVNDSSLRGALSPSTPPMQSIGQGVATKQSSAQREGIASPPSTARHAARDAAPLRMLLAIPPGRDAVTGLWRWALLGLIAGFAFYTFPLILIYLIPIGLWLLYWFRWRGWRQYLIALIGFAMGSAPWWLVLLQSGGLPLAEMAGAGVANTIPGATYLETQGVRLLNFFLFGLSAWLGPRYPWSAEFVLPLVGLVVLPFYLGALGYAVRHAPRLLWGMILTLFVTFLITPFGGDPSGRYFLPLYLPLSIFIAMLLQRIRKQTGMLALLLLIMLLGYNVTGTLLAAAKNPPGVTTQFDPITWIDHGRDQDLIDFLLEHGETRGYTTYWVQTPIAFLSGEKIISAARLPYHLDMGYTPRDDRYPPYTQAVREAPRAFYITINHPLLNDRIRARLTELGVTYQEQAIGSYHVFYGLSRKVEPEELGIYDTVTR